MGNERLHYSDSSDPLIEATAAYIEGELNYFQKIKCLKKVARAIDNSVNRDRDVVARYGGEEFVIILPRTTSSGAMQIAKRINHAIALLNIPHQTSSVADYVTISCGVASIIPNPNISPLELIANADNALYRAKQNKNCRVLFKPDLDVK